jgi:ribosomal protein S27E
VSWPKRFWAVACLAALCAFGSGTHWGAEFWAWLAVQSFWMSAWDNFWLWRIRRRARARMARVRALRGQVFVECASCHTGQLADKNAQVIRCQGCGRRLHGPAVGGKAPPEEARA